MQHLRRYSLVLVATVACTELQASFDLDDDPDDLADFDRKSDGQPCAAWSGGSLEGDDLLVLVNKDEPMQLAKRWAPADLAAIPRAMMMPGRTGELRAGVVLAAKEMLAAALDDGLELGVRSAYRSFRTQCVTFNFKVETHGLEHAKRFSAEPGRSQHQLGTTIDVSSARLGWALSQEMGSAEEGRWLANNAHRFGFALAYPDEAEDVTGYAYEPWHFRYIGREAALELASSEMFLEEYLETCMSGGSEGVRCPREELAAPIPNQGWIGGPCTVDADCDRIGEDGFCQTDGYPQGHCTMSCRTACPDLAGANATTFCAAATPELGFCHSQCDTALYGPSGCRQGYRCETVSRPGGQRSADVCTPN